MLACGRRGWGWEGRGSVPHARRPSHRIAFDAKADRELQEHKRCQADEQYVPVVVCLQSNDWAVLGRPQQEGIEGNRHGGSRAVGRGDLGAKAD